MVNDEDYDMRGYIRKAERIARRKLQMYSKLLDSINDFKNQYGGLGSGEIDFDDADMDLEAALDMEDF